jgi:hypothetical protein
MKTVQARLEQLEFDSVMARPGDQSCAMPVLPEEADASLVTRINQLQTHTLSILRRADAAGRADVALKSIREARGNMELLARLDQLRSEAAGNAGVRAMMSFGDVIINIAGATATAPGGQVIDAESSTEPQAVDVTNLRGGYSR